MTEKKNIVLVGFMGTGKTTLGQLLSERTGMNFVDMDSVIEERTGKSITDIFAQEGEAHFRKLERELVKELASQSGLVISTGGGIVLNPDSGDKEKKIRELLEIRRPLYESIKHCIQTDGMTPDEKADLILKMYKKINS